MKLTIPLRVVYNWSSSLIDLRTRHSPERLFTKDRWRLWRQSRCPLAVPPDTGRRWMGAPMNDTAQTLTDQFRLTVDYGQSLPEMIAAGHYDWTNDNITVNRFPITGAGTVSVEARLFHLFHL